jgi:hypothetical protein
MEQSALAGVQSSEVHMKACLGLVCALAFAVAANAESLIDGKWRANFSGTQGSPTSVVFDLKSNGNALTGTISSWHGSEQLHEIPVQDRKIQGDTVTFGIGYVIPFLYNRFGLRELATRLRNWGAPANTVTATLKNGSLSFTQHDWRGETMEFQAERVRN